MQPHYIYSPREMTRWVKGVYEALKPLESLAIEGLVRVWAHEALRLFQDRLIYDEERMWTDENIDMVAMKHFPNIDKQVCVCVEGRGGGLLGCCQHFCLNIRVPW